MTSIEDGRLVKIISSAKKKKKKTIWKLFLLCVSANMQIALY